MVAGEILVGVGIIVAMVGGTAVSIWATNKNAQLHRESMKEAKKSRKMSQEMMASQEKRSRTQTIVSVISIVVSVASLIFLVYRMKKNRETGA